MEERHSQYEIITWVQYKHKQSKANAVHFWQVELSVRTRDKNSQLHFILKEVCNFVHSSFCLPLYPGLFEQKVQKQVAPPNLWGKKRIEGQRFWFLKTGTVEPPIKDTLNKGHNRKNLSIKDTL